MKKNNQLFFCSFLIMVLTFSCTKENVSPPQSKQSEITEVSPETVSEKSSSLCTTSLSGRYTGISGAAYNGIGNWNWYIKNNSNFKVTAVTEYIECSSGTINFSIKKTVKLKAKEKKFLGTTPYYISGPFLKQYSLVNDKKGW